MPLASFAIATSPERPFVKEYSNFDPKLRPSARTNESLGRKNAIFEVFRKVLTNKWLHGYLSINGQFTNNKFAKGKVSLRERPCLVVRKDMFEAMKHNLWRGQTLPFAV